jgi:hypothetical protein
VYDAQNKVGAGPELAPAPHAHSRQHRRDVFDPERLEGGLEQQVVLEAVATPVPADELVLQVLNVERDRRA